VKSFSELSIQEEILKSISDMGFEEPTPIQAACIPVILEGKDVIGQAQTGTGKTAAFGIPVIQAVDPKKLAVQAIILTPTRELAIQVSAELRKISRYKSLRILPIYGGQSIRHQIRALQQGVHVVIGTPGRILDHLRRRTLNLSQVEYLILDEADEMLDMGFIDEIEQIIKATPKERQTLLFSATMPAEIRRLARRYLKEPVPISINHGDVHVPYIEQVYYRVLESHKLEVLCRIIDSEEVELGIVFCRTKKGVDALTEALQERGYLADGIHGDLSQMQRDKVMKAFREGEIELLVATDVAARGIDVSNVSHVINYDIPQDPESYVHRIGRTGRAGRSGVAMTLVTPREMKLLHAIQQQTKMSITPRELPSLEEVTRKKRSQWREQLVAVLNEGGALEQYDELIEELQAHYPLKEIARAALHLHYSAHLANLQWNEYDFGDTGASLGMVRLFINVGRRAGLKPRMLIDLITSTIGVTAQSIGRIDLFDEYSFVEVKEQVAPFVLEGLKHVHFLGVRVNVEPARPRNKAKKKDWSVRSL
jgi:ATP-dependent RNA helicase DeaD